MPRDDQDSSSAKREEPSAPIGKGVASVQDKYKSFRTRTWSTLGMLAFFVLIVYCGHVPLMFMIFTLQWLMVKELFQLARTTQQDDSLPGFRLQQWYFFGVACFYFYLRFIKNNLLTEVTARSFTTQLLSQLIARHAFIAYSAYIAGFVWFVLGLKKGKLVYQFGQYAWTHMILLVVVGPSSCFIFNIFHGLIWFLLPSLLIIANDIFAYLCGFFFGKTPLIKLSPKKTWEGFLGGFACTVAMSFLLTDIMRRFPWLTCPREDLSMGALHCDVHPMYLPSRTSPADVAAILPPAVASAAATLSQIHAAVLAVFASIIAPFGGFFASGFKRAFKLKDFGDSIPGHGGFTDRFDCQLMMAAFCYMYYFNYVLEPDVTVGGVLVTLMGMRTEEQVEVFVHLANVLRAEGLMSPAFLAKVQQEMGVNASLLQQLSAAGATLS